MPAIRRADEVTAMSMPNECSGLRYPRWRQLICDRDPVERVTGYRDTIAPRPSEALDTHRLDRWLRRRLPDLPGGLAVRQFPQGKANLTYLLSFGGSYTEYVLRRPPIGNVPAGAHDMSREFRVLTTLWKEFDKAPRALLFCDDPLVIGAPFMIMERKHGVIVQERVPSVYGSGMDRKCNESISKAVVDTLAQLHKVDPVRAGLGDLGRPDGFLRRQIDGWRRRAKDSGLDLAGAEELVAWLETRLPSRTEVAILHNDWRLDNLALDPDDPSCCRAVYDWDMCTRGDPLADLGTLLASWHEPGEEVKGFAPMPTLVPGFLSRSAAIDRYERQSERVLGDVAWFLVFGTFKMAVIIQQIYARWDKGQTDDPRFAGMGDTATQLLGLAMERRAG